MKPAQVGEKSEPIIVPVLLKLIQELSAVRLKLPSDLKSLDQKCLVMKMVKVSVKLTGAIILGLFYFYSNLSISVKFV